MEKKLKQGKLYFSTARCSLLDYDNILGYIGFLEEGAPFVFLEDRGEWDDFFDICFIFVGETKYRMLYSPKSIHEFTE